MEGDALQVLHLAWKSHSRIKECLQKPAATNVVEYRWSGLVRMGWGMKQLTLATREQRSGTGHFDPFPPPRLNGQWSAARPDVQ